MRRVLLLLSTAAFVAACGPAAVPARVQVPGLDRHEVFLTSDEAIFVFEASRADALEPLLAQPELWQAAAAWHDHVAGPPRIAEDAFSWARADDSEGVSYLATPGPGDSEGGDIY